jgi:hypothetical protein
MSGVLRPAGWVVLYAVLIFLAAYYLIAARRERLLIIQV